MGLHEAFKHAIYESHLDEASFLYEQRQRFLEDPEVTFADIAALEARHEAHLDGLVLGGESALRMCLQVLQQDDPGAIHSSLRVLCRVSDSAELVLPQLMALSEHDDPDVSAAAARALCLDYPRAWAGPLAARVAGANGAELAHLAQVIGYHAWPERALAAALSCATERVTARDADAALHCAWALGELREPSAEAWLTELAASGPRELATTAAIALAKCGSGASAVHSRGLASWSAVACAVTRQAECRRLERSASSSSEEAADALLALGICGEPACIPTLMAALEDAALAGHAAVALHLMSGVALLQEVIVPPLNDESLDEDLATADDDDAAQSPVRPTTKRVLSTDPAVWREALKGLQAQAGRSRGCVRMGGALTVERTCAALQSTALPLRVRGLLADQLQLVSRNSAEGIRFRVQGLVAQQRTLLGSLASQLRAAEWS